MTALLLAASLMLPLSAIAASSVQATRSSAATARARANDVRARQMALRQQLNQVAGRIEGLKAEQGGRLSSQLDAELKRSQELSGALTGLAQSLSQAEADAARENLVLLSALSAELSRLRGDFDRVSDRAARKQLIVQMRTLRAEREQVRAALPAASVPALDAQRSSDDPEDLLEQADALRDNEDKVRRELQALESRIGEAREERAFDRRMNEFLGDESIFDDQDRRFRLQKSSTETTTSAGSAKTSSPNADDPSGQAQGYGGAAPMAAGAPGEVGFADGTGRGLEDSFAPPSAEGSGETSVISRSAKASDARPTVGGSRGPGIAGSEDEDLEDLEVQRARLKGLAEELKLRAAKLQEKAKTLQ